VLPTSKAKKLILGGFVITKILAVSGSI